MMRSTMMDVPLQVSSVLRHAALYHGETEIVSRSVEGPLHRTTYGKTWRRSQQLANALVKRGLNAGDRVGTLAWNGYRHLEIYYGVAGAGFVCHTINPRLFPEQVAFIINHASARVLFVDLSFFELLESIADKLTTVEAGTALLRRPVGR
jgi:acyl-CoA synthetase (AMP-forming)/AMP-acid ligase II